MKLTNKLLAATAIAGVAIIGASFNASAVDQDIDASAEFRAALALSNAVDMDFGVIDYSGTSAGTVVLDAADASLTGDANYVPASSTGTLGAVDIDGETGATIEISCESTGTLSDGTNTLGLINTEVRIGGTDRACAGLGTSPSTFDLSAGTDTLEVGATINILAGGIQAAGVYNTTNASGDPITVRVVYQ
ncbi:MAG: hypothetical protein COV36_01545 [Alphaproteobacteria bacterium CG11_big_fil_rev_8_21_14_0_20_44_7]|nr:MAG: hypothetical protein COV36_01545 [Alphaproteobacteria bacterium CG11_big_fil_rev_8_21_14_0_20_44_7]